MKNSFRKKTALTVFFSLAIAVFSLVIITCRNPASHESADTESDGLISITIGGNNSRVAVPWANALDSSQLTHTITSNFTFTHRAHHP